MTVSRLTPSLLVKQGKFSLRNSILPFLKAYVPVLFLSFYFAILTFVAYVLDDPNFTIFPIVAMLLFVVSFIRLLIYHPKAFAIMCWFSSLSNALDALLDLDYGDGLKSKMKNGHFVLFVCFGFLFIDFCDINLTRLFWIVLFACPFVVRAQDPSTYDFFVPDLTTSGRSFDNYFIPCTIILSVLFIVYVCCKVSFLITRCCHYLVTVCVRITYTIFLVPSEYVFRGNILTPSLYLQRLREISELSNYDVMWSTMDDIRALLDHCGGRRLIPIVDRVGDFGEWILTLPGNLGPDIHDWAIQRPPRLLSHVYDRESTTLCREIVPYYDYPMRHFLEFKYFDISDRMHFLNSLHSSAVYDYQENQYYRSLRLNRITGFGFVPECAAYNAQCRRARLLGPRSVDILISRPPSPFGAYDDEIDDLQVMKSNYHFYGRSGPLNYATSRFEPDVKDKTSKALYDNLKHVCEFGKKFSKKEVAKSKELLHVYEQKKKSRTKTVTRKKDRDLKVARAEPTSLMRTVIDGSLLLLGVRAVYEAEPHNRPVQLIMLFKALLPEISSQVTEDSYNLVLKKLNETPDFFTTLFTSLSITIGECGPAPTAMGLEDLKNSPMYKHVHKIGCWIVGVLTSAYFKTNHAIISDIVERAAIFVTTGDLIVDIISAARSILENCYCFYQTGDISELLYGDTDSKLFLEQCDILALLSDVRTTDDLNRLRGKITTWKDNVKRRILFHGVTRSASLNLPKWLTVVDESIRLAEKAISACTPSVMPMVVQFQGPPSVAKTMCALETLTMMMLHEGITDPGPRHIWSKAEGDKFASGFEGQRFFLMDDVASIRYYQGMPTSIGSILAMVGCMTQPAIMAEAQDKGKYMYEPYGIVLTSNVKDLDAYKHFNVGQAALRRIPYLVHVSVRDEFALPRAQPTDVPILDVQKARRPGVNIRDTLLLRPMKRILSNSDSFPFGITETPIVYDEYTAVLVDGVTWYSFEDTMKILENEYVMHRRHATFVQENNASIFKKRLCPACGKVSCTCTQAVGTSHIVSGLSRFYSLIVYLYQVAYLYLVCVLYRPPPSGDAIIDSARSLSLVTHAEVRERVKQAVVARVALYNPKASQLTRDLLIVLGTLSTMYAGYRLYRMKSPKATGLEISIDGKKKEILADYVEGKVDVLKGYYYPIAGKDVSPRPSPINRVLPPSQAMTTPEKLVDRIINNMCRIELMFDSGTQIVTGCFINERTVVTVAHAFPVGFAGSGATVAVKLVVGAGTTNVIILHGREAYQLDGVDCMFFVFKASSPRPKLRQYIVHECVGALHIQKALIIGFSETGVATTEVDVTLGSAEWDSSNGKYSQSCWVAKHTGRVGESGSILVSPESARILGIQNASTAARSPEVVRSLMNVYTYFGFIPELPLAAEEAIYGTSMSFPFRPPGGNFVAADTTEYSLSKNISPGPMNVLGRIGDYTRATMSTSYVTTRLTDAFAARKDGGYTLAIGDHVSKPWYIPDLKPACRTFEDNGSTYVAWLSPLMWPIGIFNVPSIEPPSSLVDVCLRDYLNELDVLKPPDRPQGRASLMDVLNGVQGLTSVNLNSSAGYGFKGKIKDHLVIKDGKRCLKAEYLRAYQDFVDKLVQGTVPMSPFKASVKDEIVSGKKHALKKNRIFYGGSFFTYLAAKQYLGPIFAYMQQNSDVFESSIGVNCQGEGWAHILRGLKKWQYRKALDFVNFDLWIKAIIKEKFHNLLEKIMLILRVAEQDECYHTIVHHLIEEYIWAKILIGEEIFEPHTGIPSGLFGTTHVGCFVVSMLYRLVWFSADEVDAWSFDSRFRASNYLTTYGDDNAGSTKARWFSQQRMRDVLRLYNIEITAASKDDDLEEFTPLEDVTFLKRGFSETTMRGKNVVLCPLDEDSIARSIMFTSAPTETRGGVEALTIANAQKEYFFHGRDVFENRVVALKKMSDEAKIDLSIVNEKWYSYDELEAQYLEGRLATDLA